MSNKQYRQRLDSLFSEIERLIADPASATASIRHELDELRARVVELERQFSESEKCAPAQQEVAPQIAPVTASMHPVTLLYEKEQVGYVYSGDDVKPLQALPPEITNIVETIKAPLTVGGQAIGQMQIEPAPERSWSEEEANLVNAVAQQASLQIQNLRLLAATERARAEAEDATRQFIHENWDGYLDAIHHSERVGFAYDQNSVMPYVESAQADGIRQTVNVMDEHVGTLFLKPDPAHPLTDDDKEMVAAIANRIGQQVENIRLLADASRARAEAEEANRRLTHESWQAYTGNKDISSLGFVYDSNQVISIKEASVTQQVNFRQPLTVRGETIGQLAVAGWDAKISPEAAELATAIAERVSVHLETLRLAEELQKRASELQTVARVSTTASTVLNPDELLQSVVDLTKERFGLYHAHIYLADESWDTLLLASGAGEIGRQMVADGHIIKMDAEKSLVARAARERTAVIVNDVRNETDFLPNPLLPDTRSEMAVPMIVGDKVLGVYDAQSEMVNRFTDEDANIYTTLTAQVGVALQNARLYVEQAATVAQLRELDRLKSSFLANMSHELRTPLNSILGFSDVMLEELDGPLTENMNNDLKLIQKNGQHLLHLINDVLDMAKIESGKLNLNPERFKVQEILEEVTSITSTLASEKNLALFIEPVSDVEVEITADRTRIRQVMINLVNNAIKFTETGKVSICAEHKDDKVLIVVRDTGIGIPEDKLEAIFQEFTQVDSSTTRKTGGTGLGLPISRRLIEIHGGRLWAESAGVNGGGSAFFVELPLEAQISEPEKVTK